MMDTRLFFGLPGLVQEIYCPVNGVGSPRQRASTTFTAGDGSTRVQRSRNGNRTYTLDYGGLGSKAFQFLEAVHNGHHGMGPFVLLDPARRNLLTINQSSATSDSSQVDDFTFIGGSGQTLTSSSTNQIGEQVRSVLWSSTATGPTTAQMRFNSPSIDWPGWPVIGRPYSFGLWVLGGGSDPTVDMQISIDWYSQSGATLLSTSSSGTFTTTTAWQQFKLENAVPPTNAVWAIPYVNCNGATISSGTQMWFGKPMMNEGQVLEPWAPGTGILPVVPVSLDDTWAYLDPSFHKAPVLTLQEVGG